MKWLCVLSCDIKYIFYCEGLLIEFEFEWFIFLVFVFLNYSMIFVVIFGDGIFGYSKSSYNFVIFLNICLKFEKGLSNFE